MAMKIAMKAGRPAPSPHSRAMRPWQSHSPVGSHWLHYYSQTPGERLRRHLRYPKPRLVFSASSPPSGTSRGVIRHSPPFPLQSERNRFMSRISFHRLVAPGPADARFSRGYQLSVANQTLLKSSFRSPSRLVNSQ